MAADEAAALYSSVSNHATICYLQDVLLEPAHQATAVGRSSVEAIKAHDGHVRQTLLLTNDEAAQRAVFETLEFTEGADFSPEPLRVFALLR